MAIVFNSVDPAVFPAPSQAPNCGPWPLWVCVGASAPPSHPGGEERRRDWLPVTKLPAVLLTAHAAVHAVACGRGRRAHATGHRGGGNAPALLPRRAIPVLSRNDGEFFDITMGVNRDVRFVDVGRQRSIERLSETFESFLSGAVRRACGSGVF